MRRRCHHCGARFYGVHRRRFAETCPHCGYPLGRRHARRMERGLRAPQRSQRLDARPSRRLPRPNMLTDGQGAAREEAGTADERDGVHARGEEAKGEDRPWDAIPCFRSGRRCGWRLVGCGGSKGAGGGNSEAGGSPSSSSSIAYKLASVDTGGRLDPGDPIIAEYGDALDSCSRSARTAAIFSPSTR